MADEKKSLTWKVKITGAVARAISGSPSLTDDDKRVIQDWGRTIQKDGPEGLSKDTSRIAKWRDHELNGSWRGFRASSFSSSGRLLYKAVDQFVLVVVVRITATHDYEDPTTEELKEIRKLEAGLKKASEKGNK
jgi:hypothetical protein